MVQTDGRKTRKLRLFRALHAEALKKARHVPNIFLFALTAVTQAKNEHIVGILHRERNLCSDEVIGDKVGIL